MKDKAPMFNENGKTIDYRETGNGTPVLFIPGAFSNLAAWRPVQSQLPAGYRMVSTSLCGYGATQETRSLEDFGMDHEVRAIAAVAKQIAEPVHLVGHSFGGTIALAAALSGTIDIMSLVTFEANPIELLRHDYPDLLDEASTVAEEARNALEAGDPDSARRIIDYWGGDGVFTAMPEPVKEYCRTTASTNVLDWLTVFDFKVGPADYGRLNIPVLLVRGTNTNPAMVAMTRLLRQCLPQCSLATVENAGHFLISTHAAECAQILAEFLGFPDVA